MSTMRSEQLNEYYAAMAKAQAQMKPAVKNKTNPFFNSRFADLDSVMDAIRGPLTANGLSVNQESVLLEGTNEWVLRTEIGHVSGQFRASHYPIKTGKADAQGFGGGMTYARRYALSAMVGVTTDEDDDGNSAAENPEPPKSRSSNPQPTGAPSPITPKGPVTGNLEEAYGIKKSAGQSDQPAAVMPNQQVSFVQANQLNDAGKPTGWNMKTINDYIKVRFNKSKATLLSLTEYEEMMKVVRYSGPDGAAAGLRTGMTEADVPMEPGASG